VNVFLATLALILLLLVIWLVYFCRRKLMPRFGFIQNMCKSIEYKLMFNGVFRSLVETYLLLCISALTELSGINRIGVEMGDEAKSF
jgi:hypothetical protein